MRVFSLSLVSAVLMFAAQLGGVGQAVAEDPNASPAAGGAASTIRCDAQCVRANVERAAFACVPKIEHEAPGDYDWIFRPAGGLFKEADTATPEAPAIARYRGDSVRFLSPQKEWVRAIYECGFDTTKQDVSYVRIKLGVLGKPSAIPQIPAPAPQARAPQATPGSAPAAQVALAPTSDRRHVGEMDQVTVLQVNPSLRVR